MMIDFRKQDCRGIGCVISKGMCIIIIITMIIMALSPEAWASMSSQEDRYRVIQDSNNSGGTTGTNNSGSTSYIGNQGGASNYGNSGRTSNGNATSNNVSSGNKPKPNKKPKSNNKPKSNKKPKPNNKQAVNIQGMEFTPTKSVVNSYAREVKIGTIKVQCPKEGGFLKFTAYKRKKYSFTVNNINSGTGVYVCGNANIMGQGAYTPNLILDLDISTEGGRNHTMWLATENSGDLSGKLADRFLNSRTAKIALQAKQTVYLYFHFTSDVSFTLKIS